MPDLPCTSLNWRTCLRPSILFHGGGLLTREPPPGDLLVGTVGRITFVPFMPDGSVALIRGPVAHLPSGDLLPGEHVFEAALRIPLETDGFRMQRFHPFARRGAILHAWVDGDRY